MQYGSAESSTWKSRINGGIVGLWASMALGAEVTGHSQTVMLLVGGAAVLCMVTLACLWWALEEPKAGLVGMLVGAVLAVCIVFVWGPVPSNQRDLKSAWSLGSERPVGTQAVDSWTARDDPALRQSRP